MEFSFQAYAGSLRREGNELTAAHLGSIRAGLDHAANAMTGCLTCLVRRELLILPADIVGKVWITSLVAIMLWNHCFVGGCLISQEQVLPHVHQYKAFQHHCNKLHARKGNLLRYRHQLV